MNLSEDERKAVITLRTERAKETLMEAKGNINMGYWRTAANRLYYACYYIASALVAPAERFIDAVKKLIMQTENSSGIQK
jgi:hypothetical protein